MARAPARQNTRGRILEEALRCFCARGYEGTNLRELADALDITTAALYYHFRGKADILCTLVQPLVDDVELLLSDPPQDRTELLGAVLDVLLEHRTVVSLVARDRAVNIHEGIGDALAQQRRRLVELFRAGDGEEDLVRATAAVGALLRPVVELSEVDLQSHRDGLVAAVARLVEGRR